MMQTSSLRLYFLLTVGVCFLSTANAAFASHTTTFTGLGDGESWNVGLNCDDGTPNSTARAKIPTGFNVVIKSTASDGIADSIEILGTATLTVEDGRKLTLTYDTPRDSVIDGELKLEKGAQLVIEDSLAIKGDGGLITGLTTGGTATPLIKASSCTPVLTVESSVSAGSARADSVVIHGLLDVQVKLVNDAYVVADNGDLKLSTCTKSGDDGFWVAENDDRLVVDKAVSGGAEWQLLDDASAVIQFNTACPSLTGKFDITLGTIDVNAVVTSTGILDYRSVNQSHPRIDVAFNAAISFGK